MKRMLAFALLALSVLSAQAEQKLKVIDLTPDSPPTAEQLERAKQYQAEQEAAAKIPPKEAKEFMMRLVSTVDQGLELAQSGKINAVQLRNQAIALNKLQDEGARFGGLFAPFNECNKASIGAAMSWQSLIARDVEKFTQYHSNYQDSVIACLKAAG